MLPQVVRFSFFSVNMENLVDEAKSHQGTLKHDVEPGSGKDDEDDELEELRLAAINSMRPKEKAEPPTDSETDPRGRGCPLYDAGFCPRGPACALSHVRRVICSNYVAGFCPEGPACRHAHPRLDVPAQDDSGAKEAARTDETETTTPVDLTGQNLNSEESIRRRRSRSRSSSKSR